jgi:hypothetical protein
MQLKRQFFRSTHAPASPATIALFLINFSLLYSHHNNSSSLLSAAQQAQQTT